METIKLDISKTGIAVSAEMQAKAQAANALLESGKGAGNDFLGWVHLPSSISAAEIEAIEKQAAKLREKAEVIICIGIGGSYLGAKAVLEAMSDPFRFLHKEQTAPVVLFAGQNISEDYTYELLEAVKEHSIATIVISKSGTTTEPAIAFRLIKAEIEKRYGKKEAAERIVAITCATNFTTAARRSKSSAPMSPSCNISTSGGNSSTARAKASRARVSSRPASR